MEGRRDGGMEGCAQRLIAFSLAKLSLKERRSKKLHQYRAQSRNEDELDQRAARQAAARAI